VRPRFRNTSGRRVGFPCRSGGNGALERGLTAGDSRVEIHAGSSSTALNLPGDQFKMARWCGVLVVLVYFMRGTVLPRYVPVPYAGWILLTGAALALAAGVAISGGGSWRTAWVIVLPAFGAGLVQAEQFNAAASRWLGLALLIIALGPVVRNPVACALRSAAWRLTVRGLTGLTAVFVLWYALRLPNLGVGFFTAFMNQCMLAGPLAGLGVVIAIARAVRGDPWRWGLLATLGVIPVLASGSRLATLATGIAGVFLLTRRKPALGVTVALLCMLFAYRFVTKPATEQTGESVTSALASKGSANSRTGFWESRILEFKSSPIVGIGIGVVTGSGSARDGGLVIQVEPGSSYLAVLAMTGALGSVAFVIAIGILVLGFARAAGDQGGDRDVLSGVGVFLAVHGVAEGWVLAFGSPLCFLFWVWLGGFGDAALVTTNRRVERGLHALRKVGTSRPALRPA